MAIDSHTKRRAATALPCHVIPPVPDNSIDAADRWHIAGYYRIAPSGLPIFGLPIFGLSYDNPSTQSRTYDNPSTQSRTYDN